ncbi:hypothetical protein CVD28_24500 [Bacillus sp. M6-12]|uniref:hypothetical protein n=1 Tax=Bacillus sp. M6-12 TaxID=2054166 RepID=UPI000C78C973|nr:hypothetical protein [Bacillus sp. M6-12]PLS15044.1 hypothetical protein CVD28_24500 [Bacillus sp. M6-12]
MHNKITFKERHDFFKKKDYILFFFFLLVVGEGVDSFLMTVIINSVYALIYFSLIWFIDRKPILLSEKMVSQCGKRLPMKMIQHIVHNGRYIYLKFERNQYIKIYDPQQKLKKLILLNQESLHLTNQNIQYLLK